MLLQLGLIGGAVVIIITSVIIRKTSKQVMSSNINLPFVKEIVTSQQRHISTSQDTPIFPLILTPTQDLCANETFAWVSTNKNTLDQLLLKHHGILFRGFPLTTPLDFNDFVAATDLDEMAYLGGAAVRKVLAPRVLTANESPATEVIPFHHEMAQTPQPPTHSTFILTLLYAIK
jgi:hypothetical protein